MEKIIKLSKEELLNEDLKKLAESLAEEVFSHLSHCRDLISEEEDKEFYKTKTLVSVKFGNVPKRWLPKETVAGWSKETLAEEAKKYKTRGEFNAMSGSAYSAANRLGVLDEICAHMPRLKKRWTREMVLEETSKYKSFSEFSVRGGYAYYVARRFDMLEELRRTMDK